MIDSQTHEILDLKFAEFLGNHAPESARDLLKSVAVELCEAVRSGHVCLEIKRTPHELSLLRSSGLVGHPGERLPLILDHTHRLYLHRYYEYETRLVENLRKRSAQFELQPEAAAALLELIGHGKSTGDWQRMAAHIALTKSLCILTGGPGTGKTWTIVRILAVMLRLRPNLRIAIAAPTGRAAARVRESIEQARFQIPEGHQIPSEARTLHRLLGLTKGSSRPKFSPSNPLPYDIVVVDEVSMVDLPLMSKLVQALPDHCKLILAGDGDQLASVQAGSVLADLCVERNRFSEMLGNSALQTGIRVPISTSSQLLADCVVELRDNHRFEGGIQHFCEATRNGKAAEAIDIANQSGSPVRFVTIDNARQFQDELKRTIAEHICPWMEAATPESALERMNRSRLLCAHRIGPRGVEQTNAAITEHLAEIGKIVPRPGNVYAGRPILVNTNDYGRGLFNGDAGVMVQTTADGIVRAYFPGETGIARAIHPAMLPDHETAYATSVHKSQGSEFDHVVLVLPDQISRVLSRELIYTAASRARKTVEIWGTPEILTHAIHNPVRRASGLELRMASSP